MLVVNILLLIISLAGCMILKLDLVYGLLIGMFAFMITAIWLISIPAGISTDIPPYRSVIFTFNVAGTDDAGALTSTSSGS